MVGKAHVEYAMRKQFAGMALFCSVLVVLGSWMASCSPKAIEKYSEVAREPKISPDYGERWFCTPEEAEAAGWRRS